MLLPQLGPSAGGLRDTRSNLPRSLCAIFIGWIWVTTSDDSSFLYRGGFLLLALAVAVVIAAVRAAEGRASRQGAVAAAVARPGPHLLRRLPVALAGVPRPDPRPDGLERV